MGRLDTTVAPPESAAPRGGLRGLVETALLERSPLARLGFWFATAVGLAWGLPLSVGRVRRHGELIVCEGMPEWAFRRGGVCVGRVFLTSTNATPLVLRHELVHVRQWRRYGMLFPLLYGLAGFDPLRNRFEIEAGLEDGGYLPRGTGRPA